MFNQAKEWLSTWPRSLPALDAGEFPEEATRADVALEVLHLEGRLVQLGSLKLSLSVVEPTATTTLWRLCDLLGVEPLNVVERWDETCTMERFRRGEPVGGGELTFELSGTRKHLYLSYDTYFDFDHVEVIAQLLGWVGGERLHTLSDDAAVVRADTTEVQRLALQWDLAFQPSEQGR